MSDNTEASRIESLVSAEVQKQLDRERAVLKEAAGVALKIVGGAFLLLLAIFTIFGLTTWRDVAKETTSYMKGKVDELVQKNDAETGVKQILNDLVNRAIVAAELTSLKREPKKDFALPKYEWDRLRTWIKTENLDLQDFSDSLTVLAAQSETRRKADANAFLSEMLSPTDQSPYRWMRKQPDKQMAILSNFKHLDMGASALEIAQASTLSGKMRGEAVAYLGEINYVESFEKIMALATVMEDGELKTKLFVTSATLRPAHPTFVAAARNLTRQSSSNALLSAVHILRRLSSKASFRDDDDAEVVNELAKQLLSFVFSSGGYIASDAERIWITVPTDRAGRTAAHGLNRQDFERFKPYWDLLGAAANASDERAVRRPMFRASPIPQREAVTPPVRLRLGPHSALTVTTDNDEERRVLKEGDATEVTLVPTSGGSLRVRWLDQNKRIFTGKVVEFTGGGFSFSLPRVN